MARIHILGNSNAYGYGVEDRNWPELIKAETNRRRHNGDQPRITTTHIASPGNLLHHIIESGLLEASVNCNRRGMQIGVICVGACEASILRSQGAVEPRRTKSAFTEDLKQLYAIGDKLNVGHQPESTLSLVLLGVTPADPVKSIHSPEGDDFNDKRLREYDAIIRDHAKASDIRYIDVQSGFNQATMLARDGIHLSAAGDAFIYENTMPVLLDELAKRATFNS